MKLRSDIYAEVRRAMTATTSWFYAKTHREYTKFEVRLVRVPPASVRDSWASSLPFYAIGNWSRAPVHLSEMGTVSSYARMFRCSAHSHAARNMPGPVRTERSLFQTGGEVDSSMTKQRHGTGNCPAEERLEPKTEIKKDPNEYIGVYYYCIESSPSHNFRPLYETFLIVEINTNVLN